MKIVRTLWILAAATLASGALVAQTSPADHAAHHPPGQAAGDNARPAPSSAPPTAKELEESALAMHAQMARIQASKSASERKSLLEQHMLTMHHHLDMMKRMMGTPVGAAAEGATGSPQTGMMNCRQMMGGDMTMMQDMMTQMQQHLQAEGAPSPQK
jgi:hypothetical protein